MVKTKYALKKYMGHGTIVYHTAIDRIGSWLLPKDITKRLHVFYLDLWSRKLVQGHFTASTIGHCIGKASTQQRQYGQY